MVRKPSAGEIIANLIVPLKFLWGLKEGLDSRLAAASLTVFKQKIR